MKKLDRPSAPTCLGTDTEEQAQAHRNRYANPRYPSGAWRACWNDLDLDAYGVSAPRRALLAMSDNECAYCGIWILNDQMKVDHVLPKEAFPFIAYAWENLLPSCDPCNRRKGALVPASLNGKRIVERCLAETTPYDLIFDKPHLFSTVAKEDRLVDPSIDDPADHIDLLLDVPDYHPKTPLGDRTYERLLRHREVVDRLHRVRELAHDLLELEPSADQLENFAIGSSHPSLFRRFVSYLRNAPPAFAG